MKGDDDLYEEKKYAPISAWGYFGYELLFCLPVAGLVLLIVFSFSNKNINRRNFARAHFCGLAVAAAIAAAAAILAFSLGAVDNIMRALSGFFGTVIQKS